MKIPGLKETLRIGEVRGGRERMKFAVRPGADFYRRRRIVRIS